MRSSDVFPPTPVSAPRAGWWRRGWPSPDGRRLLLARALRTFGYGYLAVILALYLEQLGLSAPQIGLILTAAVAGSAVMTVFWAVVADRFGRRRTAAAMSILMVVGGLLFAVARDLPLLLVGAFTGTISATSAEVGVFITIEQAMLPQTAPAAQRTWLFALYNMLGTIAAAVGALFAGTVTVLTSAGLSGADAYRPFLLLYAVIGLFNLVVFSKLSPQVEVARVGGTRRFLGIHRSAATVARLSLLFGLDAFAGGFVVHAFIAYWFHLRWGLSVETLGVLFFWMGVLAGLSLLAAGWLAGRFGLLNTMVFTHLPSNLLLVLVPLAPTAGWAVAFLLARMAISQMDVPTRQSYTMAVVDPDERTAAAGITNVARGVASALSPALAGMALGAAAFGVPFFLAGGLKSLYDVLLYLTFRRLRPPEETNRNLL